MTIDIRSNDAELLLGIVKALEMHVQMYVGVRRNYMNGKSVSWQYGQDGNPVSGCEGTKRINEGVSRH